MREGLRLLALDIAKVWMLTLGGLFLVLVAKNGAVATAINLVYDNWLTILSFLLLIISFILTYYIRYWKYIVMPYSLK